MDSVPYVTVFGSLRYSSWRILRLYVAGLLSFIMSPIIAGERPLRNLYISIGVWKYVFTCVVIKIKFCLSCHTRVARV